MHDQQLFQHDYAFHDAALLAARALVFDVFGAAEATVAAGSDASMLQLQRLRQATTYTTRVAADAVRFAYLWAGTDALRSPSALQRCFRDIHAGTQHIFVDNSTLTATTQVLLSPSAGGVIRGMPPIRLGAFPPLQGPTPAPETVSTFVRAAAAGGLDHVCTADHVSFFVGAGTDGLLSATALAMADAAIPIYVAIYLLPLRHPTLVARQVADLELLAPGRLVLGRRHRRRGPARVRRLRGRPATRGRRMDECLQVLRSAAHRQAGRSSTASSSTSTTRSSSPPPRSRVPLIVGGRSDAAVRRAAQLGDGWIGLWNSARRYAEVVASIDEQAAAAGRARPSPRARDAGVVRHLGRPRRSPHARCRRRWRASTRSRSTASSVTRRRARRPTSPSSSPRTSRPVARRFNLIPQSPDVETAVAGAAEVRRLLSRNP